jgi:hypothetical protein
MQQYRMSDMMKVQITGTNFIVTIGLTSHGNIRVDQQHAEFVTKRLFLLHEDMN